MKFKKKQDTKEDQMINLFNLIFKSMIEEIAKFNRAKIANKKEMIDWLRLIKRLEILKRGFKK